MNKISGCDSPLYTLRKLTLYFLKLGSIGFGGPVALIGHMQDDLVTKRKWFSKEEYNEGLTLAQLAPGPLATQLAIYLDWVKGKVFGATLAGFAFILSELYLRFNSLPLLRGLFYGIGSAAIALFTICSQ